MINSSSPPQLVGAPSLYRTFSVLPLELRTSQLPASSLLPPCPSSTPSSPPQQESSRMREEEEEREGRCFRTRGSSLRGSPAPNTSSCPSPPPTRPSRAPWSRPSVTMCTSSLQRVRGGGAVTEKFYHFTLWDTFRRSVRGFFISA